MKSIAELLTWVSSVGLMARFEPHTILPPGTVLCRRYTVPPSQEASRHIIWERVNSVGLDLLNFHTPHRPFRFRNNIDGQDVEFHLSYIAPRPVEQVYTRNTVRLDNNPVDPTQVQVDNVFMIEWNIDGKPWKKWWLGSHTRCMADDFDDTSMITKADSVVVYKMKK